MIKNIISFKFNENLSVNAMSISEKLSQIEFTPCTGSVSNTAGWGKLNELTDSFAKSYGNTILMRFISEKKVIPAQVLSIEVEKKIEEYLEANGNKPSEEEYAAIKEGIITSLLPRAFPKRTETLCWLDLDLGTLNVDAGSETRALDVMKAFMRVSGFSDSPYKLMPKNDPSASMREWLLEDAPDGFTVDDKCELMRKSPGMPTIKYSHHDLDNEELRSYVMSGNDPVSLTMTFNSIIGFTLTSKYWVKGIKLKELIQQARNGSDIDEEGEITLVMDAVSNLSKALLEVSGGLPQE